MRELTIAGMCRKCYADVLFGDTALDESLTRLHVGIDDYTGKRCLGEIRPCATWEHCPKATWEHLFTAPCDICSSPVYMEDPDDMEGGNCDNYGTKEFPRCWNCDEEANWLAADFLKYEAPYLEAM